MARRNEPTIIDVARAAGVSKSLVSLVMRGAAQVSDERRAAVLAAAAKLGYRPNAVARSLVQRRTQVLGVLLSDLHNPFFTDVVEGVAAAAREHGYQALINTGHRSAALEEQAVEVLLQMRVDGVVLAAPVISAKRIDEVGAQVPTVLASRASRSRTLDSVATDEIMGIRLAVDHLVELGHRRIAHITGGTGAGARTRRRGFELAAADHGLTASARIVEGDYTEAGGIRGVEQLLVGRWPPTAVVAPNDLAAIGVLRALSAHGLRVPQDVSVIAYDDTYLAALEHIALTSVQQQRRRMGATAVELLLERLRDGRTAARHLVLEPSLTVRATTAPPPAASVRQTAATIAVP